METFLLVLFWLFALLIAFGFFCNQMARGIATNPYEWLLVMSHYEWKKTRTLMKELVILKNAGSEFGLRGIIYSDLELLEEEKLIETREVVEIITIGDSRWSLTLTEYKLTPSGTRRKNELMGKGRKKFPDALHPE